ncbi:hypothetical protein J7E55_21850 [Bacillus sp. ISL-53]|nr:hypothetical protein [Bacillus sp. ISL-53]
MSFYREIEDVVHAIKLAKEKKVNVNLLIGAGCSVTAGIPSANGIIENIKESYPREYERTINKNYANCMSKLTPTERRNLITDHVNRSKINWAHLSIAQLFKDGFINRVLTTNFDNLLQRACSLVNETPAIYDLATSTGFRPDLLFDKSILHLHGQHTGFILCNTESEVKKQAESLTSVFSDLKQQSMWIIVGYSGENDPIFDLLCKEAMFEHRLFLVGYKNNEPSDKYKELLSEEKFAFFVKGFDADDFFVTLAQNLSCFPPKFVHKPFSYLAESLGDITEYKMPASRRKSDLKISTFKIIEEAINTIETNNLLMAENYYMAGLYDKVFELDMDDSELFLIKTKSYLELKSLEGTYQAHDYLKKHIVINGEDMSSTFLYMKIFHLLCLKEKESSDNFLNLINVHLRAFEYDTEDNYDSIILLVTQLYSIVITNAYLFNKKACLHLEILLENVFIYFDKLQGEPSERKDSTHIIYDILSNIPYYLIKNGEYNISKKIIDNNIKCKQFSKLLPQANLGLWYLSNETLTLENREENGKIFYKLAIETAKLEGENIHKALIQKFHYEISSFYYNCGKEKESIENCFIAFEIGELQNYKDHFKDILILMEELGINRHEQVAVAIGEMQNAN